MRFLILLHCAIAPLYLLAAQEDQETSAAPQTGRRTNSNRAAYPTQQQSAPASPVSPANPALPTNPSPANSNPQGKSTPSSPNPSGRSAPAKQSSQVEEKSSPLAWNETTQASSCPCCTAHTLAALNAPPIAAEAAPPPANPPLRPVLEKGCNLWIRADLLYWKAEEDNLIYGGLGKSSPHLTSALQQPEAKWEWGFRLDAGYNLPRDGWDLELSYTQMRNNARGTTKAKGSEVVFPTVPPNENFLLPQPVEKAHGKWRIHLSQIDFELGREYAISPYLTVRPNGGLRTTFLYQTFNVSYRDEDKNSQRILQKNQFWGLGCAAGLGTGWKLGWGFSLYGDFAYALLLGCFDVRQHGITENGEDWRYQKGFRSGKSILDVDLGVKWSKLFQEGDWAMAFKIGYEYHLYFNQNQFQVSRGNSALLLSQTQGGDLAYQGVTFSGQFDF